MPDFTSKLNKLRKRAMLAGAASSVDLFGTGLYSYGILVDTSDIGQAKADMEQAYQDYQPAKKRLEEELKSASSTQRSSNR